MSSLALGAGVAALSVIANLLAVGLFSTNMLEHRDEDCSFSHVQEEVSMMVRNGSCHSDR